MADYYCNSAAAGGGDGSSGTPWNTLAQVKAHTFVAGDNCYLVADSEFDENLIIGQAGTNGSPITYAKSGVGADPIIHGADGWGISTNWVASRNYITLKNLHISEVVGSPSIFSNETTGWIIDSCTISSPSRTGIQMRAATNLEIKNCTLVGDRTLSTEWRGIYCYAKDETDIGGNISIHDNSVQYWTGYGIDVHGDTHDNSPIQTVSIYNNDCSHSETGVYVGRMDGADIYNNTCDDNLCGPNFTTGEEYGIALSGASNVSVYDNTCTNGRVGIEMWNSDEDLWPGYGAATANKFYRNVLAKNSGHGFSWQPGATSNSEITYNIIYGNGGAGIFVAETVETDTEGTGNLIANNVLFCNDTADTGYSDFYAGTAMPGFTFKNNILYNTNRSCLHGHATWEFVHGHNCYYRLSDPVVDNSGSTTYTIADVDTWETDGVVAADPKFTNIGSGSEDFHLTSSSPCLNKGDDLSLSLDKDKKSVASTPDIGAYEYQSSTPTTRTHLVELIVSANETARLYVGKPKVRVVAGTAATWAVCVAADGLTGDITLDVTNLPTNAVDSYGTNPIAYNGSTTVTVATTGVAAGHYDMNITGTATGGSVASVRVELEVVAAADFDLKVPVRHIRVKAGDDAVFTVEAESLSGYTSDINLTVAGVPSGASSAFGDSSLAYNASTTMTVSTGTAAAGTYDLTITGTSA